MKIVTKTIQVSTKGENDVIDITKKTADVVLKSNTKNGIITIFVAGSTAALTTIEYEPGLLRDFPAMLARIAPKNIEYGHEKMWHDGNGHSHVKAALLGPSLTVPFSNGQLILGTWQQIVLVEFDIRHRTRDVIVQIVGE